MTIIENSSSRMRLQESYARLSALLLGLAVVFAIFIIAGHHDPKQLINAALFAVAALFFRRVSRIELDKAAHTCRLWRLDMWRRSQRVIPFGDISDVRVDVMRPDTSVQVHTRLSLVTSTETIPLTAGFQADLDWHIKLRELMVDVIFSDRTRPAHLDAEEVLIAGGRPITAAMRS
jgi:hypothetical protein